MDDQPFYKDLPARIRNPVGEKVGLFISKDGKMGTSHENQDAHAQDVSNTTGDLVFFAIVEYTRMIGFSYLSMLIISALEFPGGVISLRHPYVGYRLSEDFLVKLLGSRWQENSNVQITAAEGWDIWVLNQK